ncbi:MAG TPA: DUF1592 domain-containing protein [Lacunisphaera sp.]|nr:DUF1592 domain-containing protein [Lacunisphaera sp.]
MSLRQSLLLLSLFPVAASAADPAMVSFKREIEPVLDQYCYGCHGGGKEKGGVKLDGFKTDAELRDPKLWLRVLRNTRSHIMPPAEEEELPEAEIEKLATWIKRDAFGLDPAHLDPGRVTVRRLNRVDYRNTIKELLGVEFDTLKEFPADDTGYGFDNIGDVLTISPMLLEKYLDAAQTIISGAVPTSQRVVAEHPLPGREFVTVKMETPASLIGETSSSPKPAESAGSSGAGGAGVPAATPAVFQRPAPAIEGRGLDLSYYTPATVAAKHKVGHAGRYQVVASLRSVERYVDDQFDYNRCRLVIRVDGEQLLDQEFVREGDKAFTFAFDRTWQPGEHDIAFEIKPVGPDREQKRLLRLRLNEVVVRGPFDEKLWVEPPNYARYFPKPVPKRAAARTKYAQELLTDFATRAYRRPVDQASVDRLVALANKVSAQPGGTFEAGVAQAMVAVLASPRFIFREEEVLPLAPGQAHPAVDEWSLASRLSYFLWSSMPDAELFRLAREGRLRSELPAQLARMLADPRAKEFVRNFTGQWLQARDIASVQIQAVPVFLREHGNPEVEEAFETFRRIGRIHPDARTPAEKAAADKARDIVIPFFRMPKPQLTGSLREAMQQETELTFAHVLKEDCSLLELIESDYTFLNEELAKHYGIPGVTGKEMRKVRLPPDSPRGGVLTQGTVLAVTSNPTRTSPVKRGVFILEKILGTPPAAPPPNIPALEDAASKEELAKMSLRDTLALHAKKPLCRSCHNRMDPLGLALENFNALGMWRDREMDQPVESAGQLITGEKFANVRELKHILATAHRRDYFHNIAEKLLTYALGRGLDYKDVETVDRLVAQLEAADGRPSALLRGIVESVPFQQRRATPIPMQTAEQPSIATPPQG